MFSFFSWNGNDGEKTWKEKVPNQFSVVAISLETCIKRQNEFRLEKNLEWVEWKTKKKATSAKLKVRNEHQYRNDDEYK